jgi:hypothetical protein
MRFRHAGTIAQSLKGERTSTVLRDEIDGRKNDRKFALIAADVLFWE